MRRRSPKQRRAGAAATELALWLPFLGLMFAVALDFCRIFFCAQTVQNCAWTGAMYASGSALRNTNDSTDESAAIAAAVAEGVSLNPPLAAAQVSVVFSNGTAAVTVTYPFQGLISWPGTSGTRTVSRVVTMNVAPKSPGN